MSLLYILKDNGNEGSNNSAKILAHEILDCDLAYLSDKRSRNSEFFAYQNDLCLYKFNSVRLKKSFKLVDFFHFIADFFRFYNFFRTSGYDYVLINNSLMINVLLAAMCSGKTTCLFFRELHMPKLIMKLYFFLSKYTKLQILSNNHAIKTKLPNLNVKVINNVIDTKPLLMKGGNQNKLRIILVGSIYELKNQAFAFDIINYLVVNFNFVVEVVHYGGIVCQKYNLYLNDYIEKLNLKEFVKFGGKLQNDSLSKEYSKFDIYIQSSKSEGMSRALLEAVNNGLFVIATNVGDTSQLIHEGTGILIDNDICATLNNFPTIYSNRSEVIKRAYRTLVRKYSIESVKTQLDNAGIKLG